MLELAIALGDRFERWFSFFGIHDFLSEFCSINKHFARDPTRFRAGAGNCIAPRFVSNSVRFRALEGSPTPVQGPAGWARGRQR